MAIWLAASSWLPVDGDQGAGGHERARAGAGDDDEQGVPAEHACHLPCCCPDEG
jgi:hypothetical protein